MKYRLVHTTYHGSNEFTLRIEERISVWSRFFFSVKPRVYVLRGSRGFWEHQVIGIKVPVDLIEFADEAVKESDERLRK
jgi:hypothetical protein